jgi:hypothetical protein
MRKGEEINTAEMEEREIRIVVHTVIRVNTLN